METCHTSQSTQHGSSDPYGWTRCDGPSSTFLAPTTVPDHVSLAPHTSAPVSMLSHASPRDVYSITLVWACTSLYACQGGDGFFNQKTRELTQAEDETVDENRDDSDDETDID